MMRVFAIALLAVLVSLPAASQGFDWQYSVRYPTSSPTRFVGAAIGAGYALHQGRLPYLEQDIQMPCCTYENGTGTPASLGVAFEQWTSSNLALHGSLGYRFMSAGMTAPQTESDPMADGRVLVTQYTYNAAFHYADIIGGLRYRLGSSHLSIGASLRLNVLLGTTASHREDVLSPSDFQFTTNPPSRSIEIPVAGVPDAMPYIVVPMVHLGYDVSLANGLYLSPLITLGLPLMSTAKEASWRTTDASLLIRIMRAL